MVELKNQLYMKVLMIHIMKMNRYMIQVQEHILIHQHMNQRTTQLNILKKY